MSVAYLFSDFKSLDLLESRRSVVRIPEVIARFKEAQKYLDFYIKDSPDLLIFLLSDNARFWSDEKLKRICVSLVQLALYDRTCKKMSKADFFMAPVAAESVAQILSGKLSLEEYIHGLFMATEKKEVVLDDLSVFLHKGVAKTEFAIYSKSAEVYLPLPGNSLMSNELVGRLRLDLNVNRFVNIGPIDQLASSNMEELLFQDVQVMDCISMDPMLSWFWSSFQDPEYALAN